MPLPSLLRPSNFSSRAALLFCALLSSCHRRTEGHAEAESRIPSATPAATSAQPAQPTVAETRDPVQLRALALLDEKGKVANVSCITCHSLATLSTLREQRLGVHGHRTLSHGTLSCKSCHEEDRHDRLTLAGGDSVAMAEAITLCAQCHGPQYRDYKRGSHGGMKGYWDRSVGPRERKHCVECHEPHAPAFRPMNPVLPPNGASEERH